MPDAPNSPQGEFPQTKNRARPSGRTMQRASLGWRAFREWGRGPIKFRFRPVQVPAATGNTSAPRMLRETHRRVVPASLETKACDSTRRLRDVEFAHRAIGDASLAH